MIIIRNLRKQALHLEKQQGGTHVLLVLPARESVTVEDSEVGVDIQIRSDRGDVQLTHVEEVAVAVVEDAVVFEELTVPSSKKSK